MKKPKKFQSRVEFKFRYNISIYLQFCNTALLIAKLQTRIKFYY